MSDLFLSYARDDQPKTRKLVEALRASDLNVWWDQDIPPDAAWEATIEHALNKARAVIVAWSPASVASENVKAEARRARIQGKLIQIFIEKCEPPLFFGERQGVDFTDWNGDANNPSLQTVLEAARAIIAGKRPPAGVGYAPRKKKVWAGIVAAVAVASMILGFVSNLGGARDTMCSIPALSAYCQKVGLTSPTLPPTLNPEGLARKARANLFAKVEGVWGNPATPDAPGCAIRLSYSVEPRAGEDFIVVRGQKGAENWESVGRVASAENGSIFSRTVTPVEQAGTQWELRLEADRLIQIDGSGIPTPLVRCQ